MNSINFENKYLLLKSLKNINPYKHDIKISRSLDYALITQSETLKPVTVISIIGDDFTATISSKDHCYFNFFDKDHCYFNFFDVVDYRFKSDQYAIEYKGLFKDVYKVIKPLLIIEGFDD